jgi:hypothetical protein
VKRSDVNKVLRLYTIDGRWINNDCEAIFGIILTRQIQNTDKTNPKYLEKNLHNFQLFSAQTQLECKSGENISETEPPKKGAGSRGLGAAECGRGARLNLCTNIAAKIGPL